MQSSSTPLCEVNSRGLLNPGDTGFIIVDTIIILDTIRGLEKGLKKLKGPKGSQFLFDLLIKLVHCHALKELVSAYLSRY